MRRRSRRSIVTVVAAVVALLLKGGGEQAHGLHESAVVVDQRALLQLLPAARAAQAARGGWRCHRHKGLSVHANLTGSTQLIISTACAVVAEGAHDLSRALVIHLERLLQLSPTYVLVVFTDTLRHT